MPQDALFGAPDPISADTESVAVRRTRRQADLLAAGIHPLTLVLTRPLRLHSEAAPADDRKANGRRCGDCHWRQVDAWDFPKCTLAPTRISRGAATDCRAWWPGCVDHRPAPGGRA
ncbi:hypothetical protein [Sphaerisporangium aureirubrum]|uniref:Uncharacterized protein n=1 Tax=Sphaerisporangium aureirubrum TaxID=1544736 RepID=A0ABW1ND77_9ACTN